MMAPIHDAVQNCDEERIQEILNQDPFQIVSRTEEGNVALHLAAWQDSPQIVHLLLLRGADVDVEGENGWTPLHFATYYECPKAAEVLLGYGADKEKVDRFNHSPLFYSTRRNSDKSRLILGMLLQHGANIDCHSAICLGMTELVKLILEAHPDGLQKVPCSQDFLSDAIATGQMDLVQLLLTEGVEINCSKCRQLPLVAAIDHAQEEGELGFVKILLQHGADPHFQSDSHELTPYEYARKGQVVEVVELLE